MIILRGFRKKKKLDLEIILPLPIKERKEVVKIRYNIK